MRQSRGSRGRIITWLRRTDETDTYIEKRMSTILERQQATISAAAMLRTFNRLHGEGHIDMEAAPQLLPCCTHVLRLAADNEVLHLKNEGL
jgi:hypothetical protein